MEIGCLGFTIRETEPTTTILVQSCHRRSSNNPRSSSIEMLFVEWINLGRVKDKEQQADWRREAMDEEGWDSFVFQCGWDFALKKNKKKNRERGETKRKKNGEKKKEEEERKEESDRWEREWKSDLTRLVGPNSVCLFTKIAWKLSFHNLKFP